MNRGNTDRTDPGRDINMAPLITIIMPAYNAVRFIARAVESVISQTYVKWELIVIDDGSTDGTAEYLDSISHPLIKIIHRQHLGVSSARNAGLSAATGDFITFLDADDILPPRSLETRSVYLQDHPDTDLVDGEIIVIDGTLDHELHRYKPYYQGPLLRRLLRLDSRVFFGPFYMFRKDKLGGIRFDEQMEHAEDLFFFMSLAGIGNIIYGCIHEVVYYYRRSDATAMSNMEGLEKGYLQLLKNVMSLKGASLLDRILLRLNVAHILFLSWLSKGRLFRSIVAAARCFYR